MVWRAEDPQGNEAAKIKYLIVPYTRGKVLDLGCGPSKAFPHFIGVDNLADSSMFGIEMKPDITVESCEDLPFKDESYDSVFSSHLLEHIEDYRAALAEWWRVIKVGGHLVLYLPHKDLYPNIGEPGANPDHKHDFSPEDISEAMKGVGGWDLLIDETRHEGMEYSFLQVYRKTESVDHGFACDRQGLEKTACVVRYGGFGDQIQASSILPTLKEMGYRVTMMTTPSGEEILRNDPHIDDWIIQDKDQVPNHELVPYWRAWAARFDRFINLSESVEGTLLAMPGRANHMWPHEVRHRHLNLNYLEWTAELAGLPYKPGGRFYPGLDERIRIAGFLEENMNDDTFRVMFALAGSSVHKFYPWQDSVIAAILEKIPEAKIVTTGDYACSLLEQGWEEEPSVIRLSGKLGIRDTLTLASAMHCVIGPETGVLNSVAFMPEVAKVVLLSHSSVENLTRDWENTFSMTPPESVRCYPCHRLHYTREYCWEDEETGAAMCQKAIDPGMVFDAVVSAYDDWRARENRRAA